MPKFIERRLTKLKLTSVSKSALAAMLVSGVLAATPVLANADSSSGESDVTVQTTKGKAKLNDDLRISVKNNDDGTKTISITVPNADITKDGSQSLNNATFNVKTDSDTDSDSQTSVSSGDVKQNSDQSNAKFKIDLNKSALDNDQLMNDNLTITVRDSNGQTLGTISNVTANELLKAAQQQKASQQQKAAESQSSSATSQSSSSSSSSSASSKKDDSNQNSAVISSSDKESDPSGALISSNGGDDSSNTSNSGTDTDVSSASSSSSKKASDSSSKSFKNDPGSNTSEANGNASNGASDSQTSDIQNNGGSNNGGGQVNASNESQQSEDSNSGSSNQNRQKQTFQNVNQMIAAIKKNGVASVKDSDVIVTPYNVVSNSAGTIFDGGSSTEFMSKMQSDPNVVKNGKPVEVTIDSVIDNSNRANYGGADYTIHFSNPKATNGQGGGNQGQNGQQPGQGNGQDGQGQAADQGNSQNADNSQLPQTSNGGIYQSGIGVLGLISAVLAAFGLKKAKHN